MCAAFVGSPQGQQGWVYISKIKVKLATVVKADQKARFSKATTPFHGLLHFTLDKYLILLSVKQEVPFLKSLVLVELGWNSGLPNTLASGILVRLKSVN